MSSNIEVSRICDHCGKVFIAHTTKTRYYKYASSRRNKPPSYNM